MYSSSSTSTRPINNLQPINILQPINKGCGRVFSPESNRLTTKIIVRYLPHRGLPYVSHETIGKICRKRNGKYCIDATLRLRGNPLKRPATTLSPRAARKKNIVTEKSIDRLVTSEEEYKIPYPSWEGQTQGIANRAFGDVARVEREIPPLWRKWGNQAVQAYLSYNVSEHRKKAHVRGAATRPPWRGTLPRMSDELSQHLRVLDRIKREFFASWRPSLLFDAEEFFHTEKARPAEDFHRLLRLFVDKSKLLLTSKWPLRVGKILLKEADCWVHLLTKGNEAKRFLDSVASTQAKLLVDVIRDNYECIYRCMYEDASNAKVLVVVNEVGETVFGKEDILLELVRIPRVDGKIYPKLFGEEWIDVKQWLSIERPNIPIMPRPFEDVQTKISEITTRLEEWSKRDEEGREEDEIKEWKTIVEELFELEKTVRKGVIHQREGALLFDFSLVKERSMASIAFMKERAKNEYVEKQGTRNERMRIIFATASSKLFGKGVIEQLSQVSDVQAVLEPLEKSVSWAIKVYMTIIDYYDLPDSTLRHYYEISRLAVKLRQLTDFVWKRIDLEKDWVSKNVSDESHALFFEAELLEKELESSLHKYRNCHSYSQLQRVAGRLEEITSKTARLLEKCEVIWIQRRLLQMDDICMEVPVLAKQSRLLSKLARLHYDTMSTEEDFMRCRVFDLDKDVVAEAYARLQAAYDAFVPSIAEIERESALSITRVAVDSINTTLGKLAHLLPILNAIANRNMRSHHWQMVMTAAGEEFNDNPPVSSLLEFNILEKAEIFEEVGVIADKELVVEKSMQGMKNELAQTRLQQKAPIEDWLDLQSLLGTQASRCRTLLASLPPDDQAVQLREWMETVEKLEEFVDCYVKCSRSWKHVEGVFATDDIAYQMPTEFWTFTRIRQLWQQLNQTIADQPILSHVPSIQQMKTQVDQLLSLFDNVEAGFNSYLQKKRTAFPRLHLLSHSELLDLLSQSREPHTVSGFIHLLFTRIRSFVMNGRGELTHLRSVHNELYQLSQLVNASIYKARHHVEKWLVELERESAKSIRDQLRRCIDTHQYSIPSAAKMVNEPEQIVELYMMIVTTHVVEKAIKMNALKKLEEYFNAAIKEVITHMKSKRPRLAERLCAILIKNQRLSRILASRNVRLTDDEYWSSEIRVHWNNEQVFVRLFRSVVRYDYELLGTCQRPHPSIFNHFIRSALRAGIDCMPLAVCDHIGVLKEAVAELSRTLGRPLVIPRADESKYEDNWTGTKETKEQRGRALAKAAFLIGGVALLDLSTLDNEAIEQIMGVLYEMRKDYSTTEQLRVKMDDTELIVSRSALVVLNITDMSQLDCLSDLDCKGRQFHLNDGDMHKEISSLMIGHSIDDHEKIAAECCKSVDILREILTWRPHYASNIEWQLRMSRDIIKLAENPEISETAKERQTLIGGALAASVLPSLAAEDRLVVSCLYPTPSITPHSDRILLSNLNSYGHHHAFVSKCLELVSFITNSPIVILLGPPMAGKTTLIDAARALQESKEITIDVYTFHSDVTAFESFTKNKFKASPLSDSGTELWIVLDAPPPKKTIDWLTAMADPDAAETIPVHIKIILETDVVIGTTSLPLVYVDPDTIPQPLLSPSMTSLLNSFGLFDQRTLFTTRKTMMEKGVQLNESPLREAFTNFVALQSLVPIYVVKDRFDVIKSPLPLQTLLERFPIPKDDFITLSENLLGTAPALFFARLVSLMLESNLIPVITSSVRHISTMTTMNAYLEKSFAIFEVHLDTNFSTVEHLRVAMHACQLLAGEEDLLALDPLLIIHSSTPIVSIELQECIRAAAYSHAKMKLSIVYTSSPPLSVSQIVPPRMETMAIPINAEIGQIDQEDAAVCSVYSHLLEGLKPEPKRVVAAEWKRAMGESSQRYYQRYCHI